VPLEPSWAAPKFKEIRDQNEELIPPKKPPADILQNFKVDISPAALAQLRKLLSSAGTNITEYIELRAKEYIRSWEMGNSRGPKLYFPYKLA
jgi:hypothetical protein